MNLLSPLTPSKVFAASTSHSIRTLQPPHPQSNHPPLHYQLVDPIIPPELPFSREPIPHHSHISNNSSHALIPGPCSSNYDRYLVLNHSRFTGIGTSPIPNPIPSPSLPDSSFSPSQLSIDPQMNVLDTHNQYHGCSSCSPSCPLQYQADKIPFGRSEYLHCGFVPDQEPSLHYIHPSLLGTLSLIPLQFANSTSHSRRSSWNTSRSMNDPSDISNTTALERIPLLLVKSPPSRSVPPPPSRLLLLVIALFGLFCLIVAIMFLIYCSTHLLYGFKIKVESSQFLYLSPSLNSSSSPLLQGFTLTFKIAGHNRNFVSDIALQQDIPLSVALIETSSSNDSTKTFKSDPFACSSVHGIPFTPTGVSDLGSFSLYPHKHQFTFLPGVTSRWTSTAQIVHPSPANVTVTNDPAWFRYSTNVDSPFNLNYFLFINGDYTYTQLWIISRHLPVCILYPLPLPP